jgi:hypothetical protein
VGQIRLIAARAAGYDPTLRSETTTAVGAPSVSLLFGVHARPARVSLGFFVGGTSASRSSRTVGFTERRELDDRLVVRHEIDRVDKSYQWLAVSGGAEADIAITRRLSLVPQLRVHSYLLSEHTSLVFVRPRLSVRWWF